MSLCRVCFVLTVFAEAAVIDKRRIMKNTKRIAYGGIAAALSAVMLIITSYTSYGCYAAAITAGIINLCFSYVIGKRYALMAFAAAGIAAFTMSTDKSGALLYLLFTGYYPVVKEWIRDINSRILRTLIKVFIVLLSGAFCTIMLMALFGVPSILSGINSETVPVLIFAAYVCAFAAYDYALILFEKRYKAEIINLIKKLLK